MPDNLPENYQNNKMAKAGSESPGHARLGSGAIIGELGEGGMAVIYEIWNEQLGVKRAVKVLKPGYSQDNLERFRTEMKVMAQLDHPNIVTIHSVGVWHNLPYIEMEKIDGWSLDDFIGRCGALPVEVAVAAGLIIARALSYAHSLEYTIDNERRVGLLHRDLKPANILISRKGKIRLTDFGIATPVNVPRHTPCGSIVGSLQYIAPEQLEGEKVDSRADIFSFGCVLYEMLTGAKAFPDKKISLLIPKRFSGTYDHLCAYAIKLPARLKKLVARCLSNDPQKRPSDMGLLCEELAKLNYSLSKGAPETVIRSFTTSAKETSAFTAVRRRPSRSLAYAAAFTAAAFAALLVVSAYGLMPQARNLLRRRAQPPPVSQRQLTIDQDKRLDSRVLLDSLRTVYGIDDALGIMEKEERAGRFDHVLALSRELTDRKARCVLGVLLTTRAMEHADMLTDRHFLDYHIKDAEFYLIKARWLAQCKRWDKAFSALERAQSMPAHRMGSAAAHAQAKVLKARFRTTRARQYPSRKDLRENALAAWREVKLTHRDNPEHPLYKEAARTSYKLMTF